MKADKQQVTRLVKTARGQLDGVLKMMEEDRYCMDIVNQLLAAESILHKASREVLRAHLQGCVREAVEAGDDGAKIDEILGLLDKMTQ